MTSIHAPKSTRPSPLTLGLAVILCLAAFSLSACFGSAPEAPPPTQREVLVVQNLKYDDIWTAVVRSMTKNLNVKHLDKREGVVQGRLTEWGVTEYVQASLKPLTSGGHRVEVVSTRYRSVVMRDWAGFMLEDMRKTIEKIPGHKDGDVRVVQEPL